jgi:3-oxoacyl-[acyl-carrier protein] reductase
MKMELAGKVALVTGASSGIGYATALLLGERGARVAVHYHATAEGAERAVGAITTRGGQAFTLRANVAVKREVDAMFEQLIAREGRIDILVNNAGDLVERAPIVEMSEDLWNRVMALNASGVFFCCQAALRQMLPRREGVIVNVSSVAARFGGGPGAVAYAAAKGAVLTFSKGLAREVAASGVRVNSVAPGVILTPFHQRHSTPELISRFVSGIPLGRTGTAEEVAEVIAFLASPRSSYLVGETIEVNGGQLMD